MTTTVTIQGKGLSGAHPSVLQIVVAIEYQSPANSYLAAQWFVLDARSPEAAWDLPQNAPAGGDILYHGAVVRASGVEAIPLTYSPTTTITVGDVPAMQTVSIVLNELDWSRVQQVQLSLSSGTQSSGPLSFSQSAPGPAWWSYTGDRQGYDWKAVSTLGNGMTFSAGSDSAGSPVLLVPVVPPLTTVTVSVDAAAFKALPVESVEVTLQSPGGSAVTQSFTAANVGQPWQAQVFKSPGQGSQWALSYTYSSTVSFAAASGEQAYTSPLVAATAGSLQIVEMGIRQLLVSDAEALFKLIDEIDVSMKPAKGAQSFSLTAGTAKKTMRAGTDYDVGAKLAFAADYKVDTPQSPYHQWGDYRVNGELTPTVPVVSLGNPFQSKTVTFTATGLAGQDMIQLSYSSLEVGPTGPPSGGLSMGQPWKIEGTQSSAELKIGSSTVSHTFTVVDPLAALTVFSGVIVQGGKQTPINETRTADTGITVGPGAQLLFAVEIDPSQVSWDTYKQVQVEASKGSQKGSFVFLPGEQQQCWTYVYSKPGQAGTYSLVLTYTPIKGASVSKTLPGLSDGTYVLPSNA